MSQIIVCRSQKGIVLGADAHTVEIDAQGSLQDSQIRRLFQLNAHAVLMVGGGAASMAMGAALQSFMATEKFGTVEDVYAASLPFLATEYETYMQNHCSRLPVDPIHHIYFILVGHLDNPFQAYLIWTKRHRPLLDGDSILSAYAVPRLLPGEVDLNRMCQENQSLENILAAVRNLIQKTSQGEGRQASPTYALITTEGVQMRNDF
jgi:hypothetical protein